MQLDRAACDRARQSRDPRFDGRFFIGVTSTRIYCRPICPVRAPKSENIRYFPTAAAAQAAGFRPCLRCRPEASPGTPAWSGTSAVVARGLRLISDGALDEESVERLAERLGVTARHVRRLFVEHLGATPLDVAVTRRLHFAKKLLDDTTLSCGAVAVAAGFRSVRRFNSEIRRTYARTPSELRRHARQRVAAEPDCYRFKLTYRPPYDWDALLAFLAARATPGVESVSEACYRRTIAIDGEVGSVGVVHLPEQCALDVEVRIGDSRFLLGIVERVRRIFDLGADPAVIGEHLRADPLLRRALAAHPGIRMPGAWDGFELAVRAIIGQQISVRAATTLAGRLASMFGSRLPPAGALDRLFPTAAQLADAPIERAGLMPARASTVRAVARSVLEGTVALGAGSDVEATIAALERVRGIGTWTSQYIAMRAFGEPDAFLPGDLVLRRVAGGCSAGELERRSAAWRPWRAYAVMLLWQSAIDEATQIRGKAHAHRVDTKRALAIASLLVVHAPSAQADKQSAVSATTVVEIRSYNLKPGTRDRFHQTFLAQALPMLERWKVDVVGYGPSLHDSDTYFLMRAFPSVEQRQQSEDAFYGSEEWKQGPREAILADIVSYTTVVMQLDDATLAGVAPDAAAADVVALLSARRLPSRSGERRSALALSVTVS